MVARPLGLSEDRDKVIRGLVERIASTAIPSGGEKLMLGWTNQFDEHGNKREPGDLVEPVEWWASILIPGTRGTTKLKELGGSPEAALETLLARLERFVAAPMTRPTNRLGLFPRRKFRHGT